MSSPQFHRLAASVVPWLTPDEADKKDAKAAIPFPDLAPEELAERILVPVLSTSDEEAARAKYQDRGQFLARQEDWDSLSRDIRTADSSRAQTPGGEPAAMLLAFGARADVVALAQDSLFDGRDPLTEGLDELEDMLADRTDDYPTALITALAHLDVAWAWVAHPQDDLDDHTRAKRATDHFRRARLCLAPFRNQSTTTPSLAAAHCALQAATGAPDWAVIRGYERLIDLDPESPRHMRSLGTALLTENGDHLPLNQAAMRVRDITRQNWGDGGYAWVYLDALARRPEAQDHLDHRLFTKGLRDIITHRYCQHIVNEVAAFLSLQIAPEDTSGLRGNLDWVLRDFLHELHPLVWAQTQVSPGRAAPLPSRQSLVNMGRETALASIAEHFKDLIAAGQTLSFSPQGMVEASAG